MIWILLAVLFLAAAGLLVYAAKPKRSGTRTSTAHAVRAERPSSVRSVIPGKPESRGEPYEAVSIVPGLIPCPAARELREHRFLFGEEPTLPLADCTSRKCTCRLRQHMDRRRDGDRGGRRLGVGLQSELHDAEGGPERRRRSRRDVDPPHRP